MSSSSGGGSRAVQNPSTNKLKSTSQNKSSGLNSEFTLVSYSRKSKAKPNSTSPVSPSLQQIMDNPPVLDTSNTVFNYNIPDNAHVPIMVDDAINGVDRPNESASATTLSTDITMPLATQNPAIDNNNINTRLRYFSPDYNGPIVILAECTDQDKNLGNLHPFKIAKFFSSNFTGITNIKPVGSKKVKITFNSITNGNICLSSKIPSDNGFQVNIPVSLIFSYGVIKLDNNISEAEFREGLLSPVPIENFKRISIKRDGNIIHTRTVELKFVATKIPPVISLFNMLFEVKPSIRSPVQCNRCLRFGHTQKYCRSDARCSHCGEAKHTLETCPSAQATDPVCLYCKLPHLSTDRSCQEWSTQKSIKKIMATENISYKDAIAFKKNIVILLLSNILTLSTTSLQFLIL